MPYNKSQMLYNDYEWKAYPKDDPRVTGEPDSTLLNRQQGYEMVYFINKLAEKWKWPEQFQGAGRGLEYIIRNEVPSNLRSQENVMNWIQKNYAGRTIPAR